jgi:hypothetical protein
MKKLTLFVVAICALALSACFKSPEAEWREAHPGLCTTEEVSDEAAQEMLLECLKERWDVDFEIVHFGRSNGDACQYEFKAQPVGTEYESRGYGSIVTDPKYLDEDAYIYQKGDKFFGEADRYFTYFAREDIEKYFSDSIKDIYPENKVFFIGRTEYFYAECDKNTTFEDWLKSEKGRVIDFWLFIPYTGQTKEDEGERIKQVTEAMECNGNAVVLEVVCIKDEDGSGYTNVKRKGLEVDFSYKMVAWRA